MATVIIRSSAYSNFSNSPLGGGTFTPVGDTDLGVCMRTPNDGKYVTLPALTTSDNLAVMFLDDGTLPSGKIINSVEFSIMAKGTNFSISSSDGFGPFYADVDFGSLSTPWNPDPPSGFITELEYTLYTTGPIELDPRTSLPWNKNTLFSRDDGFGNTDRDWFFTAVINDFPDSFSVDYAYLTVIYEGLEVTSAFPSQGGIYGGVSVQITGSGFLD